MSISKCLSVNQNPRVNDLGLLALRVMVGASLFLNHGWEKLTRFSEMTRFGMDPIHIGVYPSLAFATFVDGICALLIIVGLFTRAATFFTLMSLSVVFFVMEHALSFGARNMPGPPGMPGPPPGGHTELVFLYLAVFLVLFIVGPGSLSLDGRLRWGARD